MSHQVSARDASLDLISIPHEKKTFLTFKDYINSLKRLQKVAQELQDIDNDMGGELSRMDSSDPAKEESKTT